MLPTDEKYGTWAASGEIDIMEQWGNDGSTNQSTGAAHLGNGCQGSSTYQSWDFLINESFADDFHIYSIIWYENYIGWYIDGDLKHFISPNLLNFYCSSKPTHPKLFLFWFFYNQVGKS